LLYEAAYSTQAGLLLANAIHTNNALTCGFKLLKVAYLLGLPNALQTT
jgi:hypothetical protein